MVQTRIATFYRIWCSRHKAGLTWNPSTWDRARWKQPNISSKLSNHQWPAESLPLPVGYWFKWKYVLFCNYLRLKCALGNFGEVAVRSNSLAQESLPLMQQMGLCLIQLRSSLQMLLRYKIGACTVIAAHLLGTIRNRGHARLSPSRKKKTP